jgi:hypothetical protein
MVQIQDAETSMFRYVLIACDGRIRPHKNLSNNIKNVDEIHFSNFQRSDAVKKCNLLSSFLSKWKLTLLLLLLLLCFLLGDADPDEFDDWLVPWIERGIRVSEISKIHFYVLIYILSTQIKWVLDHSPEQSIDRQGNFIKGKSSNNYDHLKMEWSN